MYDAYLYNNFYLTLFNKTLRTLSKLKNFLTFKKKKKC